GRARRASHTRRRNTTMPKTIETPKAPAGEFLYNPEEKLFEDIKARPGEKAFVFLHTVPYEGSVGLVNLLTATRLGRKGFEVNVVLYGPDELMDSGPGGCQADGRNAFPR